MIRPNTVNFSGGNRRFGYTAVLADSDVCDIVATRRAGASAATVPQFIGDSEAAQSVTVTGMEFEITGKEHLNADRSTTLLIIGNETGGRATVNITVRKVQVTTVGMMR